MGKDPARFCDARWGRPCGSSDAYTRSPRNSPRPLPARPGWTSPAYMRGSECLRGIPCRGADENGIPAPSSPLDRLEPLPVHFRRALVGLRQHICVDQNVFAVYLVVELMKTEFRLLLRLSIASNLSPSTSGAPWLDFASIYAWIRMSSRYTLSWS